MDIDEIRRANLKVLERELGKPKLMAEAAGMSYAQYVNYRDGAFDPRSGKKRGMRKETAWRFEDACKRPRGWLDQPHTDAAVNVTGAEITVAVGQVTATVKDTVAQFGELLAQADEQTRGAVADLMLRYASNPAEGGRIAQAIEVLLEAKKKDDPKL